MLFSTGLELERIPAGASMRVTAALPDGSVEALVWLHGYDARFRTHFC
jgi:hypothetical protein